MHLCCCAFDMSGSTYSRVAELGSLWGEWKALMLALISFIPCCQGLQRASHCFWSRNSVKEHRDLILDGLDGQSCSCPACYEHSNALFCRKTGQPAIVSGPFCKPHSLPDLCGYLWILFLCYEEDNNTEQFLSNFWPFTSDFKYPLIFSTVFSNSRRDTFFDHVPSVVLYILV